MIKKTLFFLALAACCFQTLMAQDATELVKAVKAKLNKVKDYSASGVMKTDVVFIKAPVSRIKVYYKSPNRFSLKKDGGISLLPKGGVSVSMSSLIGTEDFTALDAGEAVVNKIKTRIVKLLPNNETSDVVLSTLYIDAAEKLIIKAITTTLNNGTYDMTMSYGNYAAFGLPDKVTFSFNTKNYKLPKGITMEMGEGNTKTTTDNFKNKKGSVEITYNSYIINKGLNDNVFSN